MGRKKLDFSKGDPLLPLTKVANYAFRQSLKDLNRYTLPTTRAYNEETGPILRDLTRAFTARGFKPQGWTGLPTDHMLMTGGGTTEAYDLIVRSMAEDVRAWNAREGRGIKPAMLMPVPTYGFFFDNLRHHGIEAVPVARDLARNGALAPESVVAAIRDAHAKGLRIVGFYDSNPNNPFGRVRGEKETHDLYRIINALNYKYAEEDSAWYAARREAGKACAWRHEGIAAQVRVIDDMVYDGLEYEGAEKPFAFGQLRDTYMGYAFGHSLTLFGPSKAGLANIRAGLIVGPSKLLEPMRELQRMTAYSPPKPAVHSLHAYFSDKGRLAAWRDGHMKTMNERHRFNGLFMKALLAGLKNSGATADEGRAITVTLARTLNIDEKEAAARLRRPVPFVRVLTDPQAGFFHVLDLNGLKGRTRDYDGRLKTIESGFDLERLLYENDLQLASGAWMGLDDPFIMRASFANSFDDIADFAGRLREIAGSTKSIPAVKTVAAPR
jgi:aspartate/methionine/tyrosine aminotransferase